MTSMGRGPDVRWVLQYHDHQNDALQSFNNGGMSYSMLFYNNYNLYFLMESNCHYHMKVL